MVLVSCIVAGQNGLVVQRPASMGVILELGISHLGVLVGHVVAVALDVLLKAEAHVLVYDLIRMVKVPIRIK